MSFQLPYGLSATELGTIFGWLTAMSAYLALGYMTFVYRWRET
jgi:hypothetical protein